jgi:RNA-splicing ligase RtcB
VPAGNVYAYENAAGETVEEMENRQGKLVLRRFYRPAPPACAYLKGIGLNTDRYWRDDGEQIFHCLSPYKDVGAVVEAAHEAKLARMVARLEPRICVKG